MGGVSRRRPALVVCAAFAFVATCTVALPVSVAGPTGTVAGPPVGTNLFADLSSDSTAPDVVLAAVTTVRGNQLVFTIYTSNRSGLQTNDSLFLDISSDRNRATGGSFTRADPAKGGIDYDIGLDGKSNTYGVYRVTTVNGKTKEKFVKTGTSASSNFSNGRWQFTIKKSVLGNPRQFDFYIYTASKDPAKSRFDYAPATGMYTYPERATRGAVNGVTFKPAQTALIAGRKSLVTVNASVAGKPYDDAKVLCFAFLLNSTPVPAVEAATGKPGQMACSITPAANLKGQTVVLEIVAAGKAAVWTDYIKVG